MNPYQGLKQSHFLSPVKTQVAFKANESLSGIETAKLLEVGNKRNFQS